ncbi:MAG: class I SAM-dependent methyltransferase [Carbonactinosporaceae bacterium]
MTHQHLAEFWLRTLPVSADLDAAWLPAAVDWLLAGDRVRSAADIGCGAGAMACALATALGEQAQVTALDADPRLLAMARARASATGVPERIEWIAADLASLPLDDASMDFVWASSVVHHLPDQQNAVARLGRLLRPGGRLALCEGGLPLRCLPYDIGVGRPGLEARLDAAHTSWFEDMRAELEGPRMPYGWPEALRRAGLTHEATRSFLIEHPPPLDDLGRRVVEQHLSFAAEELAEMLSRDDREALQQLLDPGHDAYVGLRDDVAVTTVRSIHVGQASR